MSGKTLTQSEILSLSDDQLYNELLQFNLTAGPIVDSTRKIYQRKLIKLMGGDVVDSSFNGEVDDDEYSDSDSEGKVTKSTYSAAQSPSSSTVRSRVTTGSPASSLDNSLAFDHDRHTPSPRPSLRTASSSTTTTSTKYTGAGKTFRETTSLRHTYTYPSQMEQSPDATSSYLGRLLVKCIFILILLTALYFTYQYMYSESPLKGLKNLAQQASDLANGNTKKESKVKSKP